MQIAWVVAYLCFKGLLEPHSPNNADNATLFFMHITSMTDNYFQNLDQLAILKDSETTIVYIVQNEYCQRFVIKALKTELSTPATIKAFIDKARAMQQLSEQATEIGLAKVLHINETDYFYVMEHIEGMPLSEIAKSINLEKDEQDIIALHNELACQLQFIQDNNLEIYSPDISDIIISNDGKIKLLNFTVSHCNNNNKSGDLIAKEFVDNFVSICRQIQIHELKRSKRCNILIMLSSLIFLLLLTITYAYFFTNFFSFLNAKLSYQSLTPKESYFITQNKDNKKGLLNIHYEELLEPQYDEIELINDNIFKLRKHKLYAVCVDGVTVSGFIYDHIGFDKTKNLIFVYKNGVALIFDPYKREYIYRDSDYIPYKEREQMGYKNPFGDILITPSYTEAHLFENGIAKVRIKKKCGLINTKNEKLVPVEYDQIIDYDMHYAVVEINGLWGMFNINNASVTIACKYDRIKRNGDKFEVFKNGVSLVADNYGNFLYRDSDLFPVQFNDTPPETNWGVIDRFGNIVLRPKYYKIGPFKQGRAVVVTYYPFEDDYQYIDRTGNVVIEKKFAYADDFENGRARVKDQEWFASYYYIDLNGNKIH